MKIKARTSVSMSKEEICQAIKLWAEQKGIAVEGEIDFQIEEVWDPTDWQGKYGPIDHDVKGATFLSASQDSEA